MSKSQNQNKMYLFALLVVFTTQISLHFYTLSYALTSEICSLSYTPNQKKVPHSGGASHFGPFQGVPPPPPPHRGGAYIL